MKTATSSWLTSAWVNKSVEMRKLRASVEALLISLLKCFLKKELEKKATFMVLVPFSTNFWSENHHTFPMIFPLSTEILKKASWSSPKISVKTQKAWYWDFYREIQRKGWDIMVFSRLKSTHSLVVLTGQSWATWNWNRQWDHKSNYLKHLMINWMSSQTRYILLYLECY